MERPRDRKELQDHPLYADLRADIIGQLVAAKNAAAPAVTKKVSLPDILPEDLMTRDTLRFAMKANAMRDDAGMWHDVFKKPATDPGKGSKAGRQAVIRQNGALVATRLDAIDPVDNLLRPVWRNGELLIRHGFAEVRARSEA